MKRLKTDREYHDSYLVQAEWINKNDLQLSFNLDGHWNDNMDVSSIIFYGVRNTDDVMSNLEDLAKKSNNVEWIADVVGFVRESKTTYLLDTAQGCLTIDAQSFFEV